MALAVQSILLYEQTTSLNHFSIRAVRSQTHSSWSYYKYVLSDLNETFRAICNLLFLSLVNFPSWKVTVFHFLPQSSSPFSLCEAEDLVSYFTEIINTSWWKLPQLPNILYKYPHPYPPLLSFLKSMPIVLSSILLQQQRTLSSFLRLILPSILCSSPPACLGTFLHWYLLALSWVFPFSDVLSPGSPSGI